MQEGIWLTEKPVFDRECVFVTKNKWTGGKVDYQIWQIKALDGEDNEGNPAWYWGLLNGDSEEWGPLDDLSANEYFIIPDTPEIAATIKAGVDKYIKSLAQPVSGGVDLNRVKELEEALAHLLKMSDTWGHEWFNDESWAKLENARKVLDGSLTDIIDPSTYVTQIMRKTGGSDYDVKPQF